MSFLSGSTVPICEESIVTRNKDAAVTAVGFCGLSFVPINLGIRVNERRRSKVTTWCEVGYRL